MKTRESDRQMYVFHGSSISGQVGLIRRMASGEQIEKKQINHTGCYVSWQNPDDKVNSLSDLIPGKPDRGWGMWSDKCLGCFNSKQRLERIDNDWTRFKK